MTFNNSVAPDTCAISATQQAGNSSCLRLRPLREPMTDRQLREGAETIAKVIRARCKVQQLRDRADALESALLRFKTRREARRS